MARDPARRAEAAVDWPALGLSACVLGLVLCPFAYIAIGALSGFAPAFALIALPPLLVGVGYLLYRYLRTPAQGAASAWQLLAEGLAWLPVIGFLWVVSDFTLLTSLERVGWLSTLFLSTTLIALPIVLRRRTALASRLQRWPKVLGVSVLVGVLLAAVGIAVVHGLRAPALP